MEEKNTSLPIIHSEDDIPELLEMFEEAIKDGYFKNK